MLAEVCWVQPTFQSHLNCELFYPFLQGPGSLRLQCYIDGRNYQDPEESLKLFEEAELPSLAIEMISIICVQPHNCQQCMPTGDSTHQMGVVFSP